MTTLTLLHHTLVDINITAAATRAFSDTLNEVAVPALRTIAQAAVTGRRSALDCFRDTQRALLAHSKPKKKRRRGGDDSDEESSDETRCDVIFMDALACTWIHRLSVMSASPVADAAQLALLCCNRLSDVKGLLTEPLHVSLMLGLLNTLPGDGDYANLLNECAQQLEEERRDACVACERACQGFLGDMLHAEPDAELAKRLQARLEELLKRE